MNLFRIALFSVPLLIWTNASLAQDTLPLASSQQGVDEARAAVKAVAHEIKPDLVALIPSAPGWKCGESNRSPTTDIFELIPSVQLQCEHEEQSLLVNVMLDPSTSLLFCRSIARRQQGIADGRILPRLFRFFESEAWQIERAGVSITACAADTIAFSADGESSEAAIGNGPDSIDAFAQALLASNPDAAAAKASTYTAAIDRLLALLDEQSRQFSEMIDTPANGTLEVLRPSDSMRVGQSLLTVLSAGPSAHATLEVDDCRLIIEVSASPLGLHEAKNTGLRWASPRTADGTVRGAYVTRNTERLKGLARRSGTSIEVLVDDLVLVRVVAPGNRICASDPDIVRRTFDEILARDPSTVVMP